MTKTTGWSLAMLAASIAIESCRADRVQTITCDENRDCESGICSADHTCQHLADAGGAGGASPALLAGEAGAHNGPKPAGSGGASGGLPSGGGPSAGESGASHEEAGTGGAGGRVTRGQAGEGGTVGEAGGTASPVVVGDALGGSFDVHCVGCTRTPRGTPTWEPTGAVLATALVGEAPGLGITGWLAAIVAPLHRYYPPPDDVYGPAKQHLPPYADELYELLSLAGQTPKQVFSTAEYTSPSGVAALFLIVPSPGAPRGSSADFDEGPILENELFPVNINPDLLRNGTPVNTGYDSSFIGYAQMHPPIAADGASHFFVGFPANDSFSPTVVPGDYEIRVTLLDTLGSGWTVSIPFTVGD